MDGGERKWDTRLGSVQQMHLGFATCMYAQGVQVCTG